MAWFTRDWLGDPAVSLCTPATRGIWKDLLDCMHELNRCGELSGTPEQLSRLGRCSTEELAHALDELSTRPSPEQKPAADIQTRNGIVTIINRRMKREYDDRQASNSRVLRHRAENSNANETQMKRDCNAIVTLASSSSSSSFTPPVPKGTSPPGGGESSRKSSNRKTRRRHSTERSGPAQDANEAMSRAFMEERREKYIMARDAILSRRKNGIAAWWAEQKQKIAEEINEHSFVAFIEPLEAIERTEGKLVLLSCPDSADWVREHYSELIAGELGLEVQILSGMEE